MNATTVPSKNFTKPAQTGEVAWRDLPAAKRTVPSEKTAPNRPFTQRTSSPKPAAQPSSQSAEKPEHGMLFQEYFKSVGTRTYVAQLKVATNGNHYLVLTEANRAKGAEEVRKTRIFIYSEDFKAFFDLVSSAQKFITANPVPADVAGKQAAYWRKFRKQPAATGTANSTSAR